MLAQREDACVQKPTIIGQEFQDLLRCVSTLSQKPGACAGVRDNGAVNRIGMFPGNSAYVFGPQSGIEACISELTQRHLLERQILAERFPNSETSPRSQIPVVQETWQPNASP